MPTLSQKRKAAVLEAHKPDGAGLRSTSKGMEKPPDPKMRASFQDTTGVV